MRRALVSVVLLCAVLVPTQAAAQTVHTCNGLVATIVGTPGDDRLIGTPGPDVIVGRGGDDIIRGKGGADVICAGGGRDDVKGGSGSDWIDLGKGRDVASGGPGRDYIEGGTGGDRINGNKGVDTIRGQRGADTLIGGTGWDDCRGGAGSDSLDRCERKLPVVADGSLVGIELGTGAGETIRRLTALFGPPRSDTGWVVGCPLFDGATNRNERYIDWGSFGVDLYGEPGERRFISWSYSVDADSLEPLSGGPKLDDILLPGGVQVGDRIWDAAIALNTRLERARFGYGWRTFVNDNVELSAFRSDSLFDPVNVVSVGNYLVCD